MNFHIIVSGHTRSNILHHQLKNINCKTYLNTYTNPNLAVKNRIINVDELKAQYNCGNKIIVEDFNELELLCKNKVLIEHQLQDWLLSNGTEMTNDSKNEIRNNPSMLVRYYMIPKKRNKIIELLNDSYNENDVFLLTRFDVKLDLNTIINYINRNGVEDNTIYSKAPIYQHDKDNKYWTHDIILWGNYSSIIKLLEQSDYYDKIVSMMKNKELSGWTFYGPHTILGFYLEIVRKMNIIPVEFYGDFDPCVK